MNIDAAKPAVDNEEDKSQELPAWNTSKVKIKQDVINEAKVNNRKVHFFHTDGPLPPETLRIGRTPTKIQRQDSLALRQRQ